MRRLADWVSMSVRAIFPLRVAFPVLLMNAIDWFTGDVDEGSGSFRTGRRLVVPLRGPSVQNPRSGRAAARSSAKADLTQPGDIARRCQSTKGL